METTMRPAIAAAFAATALLTVSCAPEETMTQADHQPDPPVAEKRAKELEIHGDVRQDDYYWLRERENPEVISYLEAENAYLEAVMAPTEALQEELFEEIVARIQPDDSSVPYEKDGRYYYWRYPEGGEYRIWARKSGSVEADEEVMFDGNVMAEGEEFFALRGVRVAPEHDVAAYAVDTVGRRKYTRRFRDLSTGEDLPDAIADVTPNGAWANDGKSYFYTRQDPDTLRWYQIYRHVLGTDPSEDVLVYEEADEEFSSYVYKTKSDRLLVIASVQTLSSEYRVLDADDPTGEFQVVQPREADHEYSVDHLGDHLYIRTNWDAQNFRLMRTPLGSTSKDDWEEVLPHREDVYLAGFELFDGYLVAQERKDALVHMRVQPWAAGGPSGGLGGEPHYLDFGEPAYDAYFGNNVDVSSGVLRYRYTSLTTPNSVFDYDMASREKTLLKEEAVLGGFDKANYTTERLWAPAADGTQIPVSIVYANDFPKDGTRPLLLYAYGSYGSSMDPGFRSYRLSLIDRGFAFAIAHIRGGQEMGRQWYENGKLFKKKNTFTDFIDVGRHLVAEGYTSSDGLFAEGGSAGGLLMGAVTNMAPELFRGVASHVPFVDVVTTMLDDSIPLTTSEYDEWGNPNEKDYYDYMLSYSPYDNLEAKDYPNILAWPSCAA
jgi:oligopeptidase B